jgi:hypothetical protein
LEFKDLVTLIKLVGKENLLKYAKETGNYDRVKKLIDIYERIKSSYN